MKKTAPYLVIMAARQLKANLKESTESSGRGAAPFHLLTILADKPFTILEVAEKLSCSKQEASRLVKAAEGNLLLSVISSANDKRVKRVFISKKGRQLLKEGAETYNNKDAAIKKLLGEGEYRSFKKSLEKLCESVGY